MTYFGLFGFLVAVLVVASSGALFKPGPWYAALAKPGWTPPDWLFGPAWAVLYVMIAFSGWLVWQKVGFAGAALPFGLYVLQLLLNASWSAVFFGLKRMDLAFGVLVVLWLAIAVNIAAFLAIDSTAGFLLVPYLCWVTFAGALNLTVWRLNDLPAGSRG